MNKPTSTSTVPRRVRLTLEFVADFPPLSGDRADAEADRIGDLIVERLQSQPVEGVYGESFKIVGWSDEAEEDGDA